MKCPVFLFSFANDAEGSLRLGEEMNACWNELAALDQAGTIDCQRMGFASLEQIYQELNLFKDQVFLFHYGGHSTSDFLELQGGKGRAENFGHKLAQQFYKALASGDSIGAAFDSAKAFLMDKYPELASSFRSVGIWEDEIEGEDFEWGIYCRSEAALDWSIRDIQVDGLFLLQQLREASRERHRKFTSQGGRFQHLKIEEAILSGIEGYSRESRSLIEEQISLEDQPFNLEDVLPQLWDRGWWTRERMN